MELKVKERTIFGKKVKTLRRKGLIPAELYGLDIKNKHLSVPEKEFSKIYKDAGEYTIINAITEENEKIPVLISDVAYANLHGRILSIDLRQIRMDEKIETKVPIEFSGEAPAVKNGFLVVTVLNELEIEALPANIPHRIEVDLTSLENVGQSIRISGIKIPKDVKILVPEDTVIVTISERAKEEAAPAPSPAAEGAAEAPEAETSASTENKAQEKKETS